MLQAIDPNARNLTLSILSEYIPAKTLNIDRGKRQANPATRPKY